MVTKRKKKASRERMAARAKNRSWKEWVKKQHEQLASNATFR